MRFFALGFLGAFVPAVLSSQGPVIADPPKAVVVPFIRFTDIFGGRLVAAFQAIPADRYQYRPSPTQQSVGYIAQHLEVADYGLCERFAATKRSRTPKDSLADTLKANWPKDTLLARLDASLRFCDEALGGVPELNSAAVASTLLAFETDLAEHFSQLAVYMRLLGLVPPSALPLKQRTAIALPAAALTAFVGSYDLFPGIQIVVTVVDSALFARSVPGGSITRLWPEADGMFFVQDVDIQIDFVRDSTGRVTGLVLHQFGRAHQATRAR